jgi:hypothetical protein
MELSRLAYIRLEKELTEAELKFNVHDTTDDTTQLDEISKFDLVVTYYRHLGLDPYKLRGPAGQQIRAKIKNSPAFQAWLKTNKYENVQVGEYSSLIETIKTAKKSKRVDITFYGYPDSKNSIPSDTVKDETGTNFNYLSSN